MVSRKIGGSNETGSEKAQYPDSNTLPEQWGGVFTGAGTFDPMNAFTMKALTGGINSLIMTGMYHAFDGEGFKNDYSQMNWQNMTMSSYDLGNFLGGKAGALIKKRQGYDEKTQTYDLSKKNSSGWFEDILGTVLRWSDEGDRMVKGVFEAIGEYAGTWLQGLGCLALEGIEALGNGMANLWNGAKNALAAMWDGVVNFVKGEPKDESNKEQKKINAPLQYGTAQFYETAVYLLSGGVEYNFHSKDTGLNMITLQNYVCTDPLASEEQKADGAYSVRGSDLLKSQMVIIENGKVLGVLYGTPEPSMTKGVGWDKQVEVNMFNSIAPGEYVTKGVERNGTWQMRIYEDSEFMRRDDRGGITSEMLGDNVVNGKQLKIGDQFEQSGLLIHDASNKWSGSLGCTVVDGFDNWAKNYAGSLITWQKTFGRYYVVDYNRLQWKYHDEYLKKNK